MTLSGLIVLAGCAHGVMQLKNAVRERATHKDTNKQPEQQQERDHLCKLHWTRRGEPQKGNAQKII